MKAQDIEALMNRLSRRERLEGGIFFTQAPLVDRICRHFDFSQIHRVIDSAAGSCNFLIPLAEKYPHIEFYGVEKHPRVFRDVEKKLSTYPNLHYFQGDILLDDFPIPPCDLYLGNPPFVNFTDLPEDYREKIRPLWQQNLELPRGFSLLLGHSRADIAQLIFQYTLNTYLTPRGQFGVILPDTLLRGDSAQAGFQQCSGFAPRIIEEIDQNDAFYGTSRPSFFMIGEKGRKAEFPIPCISPEGIRQQLWNRRGKWVLGDGAQWPDSWLGNYQARQGINTLGANKIFFFKEKPDLEEELLFPLLKSSDVRMWESRPEAWVLLPYKEGKLFSEEDLQMHFPRSWKYLNQHKETLSQRKSRFARKHWYALFGIGPYTFAPYRVTWRALGARSMAAAVVQRGIPNQAMHGYIPLQSEKEAHYLAGLLNSRIIQQEILGLTRAGSKSFGQPGIISRLPLPLYSETDTRCLNISALAEENSRNPQKKASESLHQCCKEFLELDR